MHFLTEMLLRMVLLMSLLVFGVSYLLIWILIWISFSLPVAEEEVENEPCFLFCRAEDCYCFLFVLILVLFTYVTDVGFMSLIRKRIGEEPTNLLAWLLMFVCHLYCYSCRAVLIMHVSMFFI